MHDEISYCLRRVRIEIRQARRAAKREASAAHFNLADAYLERIHRFFEDVAGEDAPKT